MFPRARAAFNNVVNNGVVVGGANFVAGVGGEIGQNFATQERRHDLVVVGGLGALATAMTGIFPPAKFLAAGVSAAVGSVRAWRDSAGAREQRQAAYDTIHGGAQTRADAQMAAAQAAMITASAMPNGTLDEQAKRFNAVQAATAAMQAAQDAINDVPNVIDQAEREQRNATARIAGAMIGGAALYGAVSLAGGWALNNVGAIANSVNNFAITPIANGVPAINSLVSNTVGNVITPVAQQVATSGNALLDTLFS